MSARDAAGAEAEFDGEIGGVFDEDAGLFLAAGDDGDFEFRRLEGGVEGLDGDGCGLTPLAIAAQDEVFGFVARISACLGLGEAEFGGGPVEDVLGLDGCGDELWKGVGGVGDGGWRLDAVRLSPWREHPSGTSSTPFSGHLSGQIAVIVLVIVVVLVVFGGEDDDGTARGSRGGSLG